MAAFQDSRKDLCWMRYVIGTETSPVNESVIQNTLYPFEETNHIRKFSEVKLETVLLGRKLGGIQKEKVAPPPRHQPSGMSLEAGMITPPAPSGFTEFSHVFSLAHAR